MRRLLPSAFVAVVAAWIFSGCSPEEKRYVPNAISGELTPTMATSDVSTLISDSGYTRYHLTAALWEMYEDAEEPFWKFPNGLELEQYDLKMNPEANVVCDSAVYFSRKRLWRLDGNVVMVNTQADSFLTQQLFWDQTDKKIYTDSFIHIVRTDRTIEGYGMESDQSMIYYTVKRPTAILPANSLPGGRKNAKDSTAAEEPSASRTSPSPAKPDQTLMANPEEASAVSAPPSAQSPSALPSSPSAKKPIQRKKLSSQK